MLTVLVILIVVGFLLWLANTYIPMDGKIKKIMNVAVVVLVILWLLSVFGILPALNTAVPRLHWN